jgi:hypothetical protein
MGEGRRDRAAMLCQLANLPAHPESVPINLLVQVEGTCPPMPLTLIPSGDCRGQQPGAPALNYGDSLLNTPNKEAGGCHCTPPTARHYTLASTLGDACSLRPAILGRPDALWSIDVEIYRTGNAVQ